MAYKIRSKKVFLKRLNEMIKDEYKAPKDYAKLKSATNNFAIERAIDKIVSQEKAHYETLTAIKKMETKK
jgi:rubrerythrin